MFPPLNEERRHELVKETSKMAEEAKIALLFYPAGMPSKNWKRNEKAGEITEDDLKHAEKKTQELTRQICKNAQACFERKEKGNHGDLICDRKKEMYCFWKESCAAASGNPQRISGLLWMETAGGRKSAACLVPLA